MSKKEIIHGIKIHESMSGIQKEELRNSDPNLPISPELGDLTKVKVKVSLYLDQDIVDAAKAKVSGTTRKYQSLINEVLRQALIENTAESELVKKIEQILDKKLKELKVG